MRRPVAGYDAADDKLYIPLTEPRDDNSPINTNLCMMTRINDAVAPLVADGRKYVSVRFIGRHGREYGARAHSHRQTRDRPEISFSS